MSAPNAKPATAVAAAAFVGVAALAVLVFSTSSERPPEPPPVAPEAPAVEPPAPERDVRVGVQLFKTTAAGPVLLEKDDHRRQKHAMVTGTVPLEVKVTNEGSEPYNHLTFLVLDPVGRPAFLSPGEEKTSTLSMKAPRGLEQKVALTPTVGPELGRYTVVAVFSDAALGRADLKLPAVGSWDPKRPHDLAKDGMAEVHTVIEVEAPRSP